MKMGFKITGLDEMMRDLEKLQQRAHPLHGKHEVTLDELYPPAFIASHTLGKFLSVEDWVRQSPFGITTAEDVTRITDEQWDPYVRSTTDFTSWAEMKQAAIADFATRGLGL